MGNCELGDIKKRPHAHGGEEPPSAERQREEKEQLGKCRTVAGPEKDLRLRVRRIRSLIAGFLRTGTGSLFTHLGRRGARGLGAMVGQGLNPQPEKVVPFLEGCATAQNLPASATPGRSGWAKGSVYRRIR